MLLGSALRQAFQFKKELTAELGTNDGPSWQSLAQALAMDSNPWMQLPDSACQPC